jgi:VWFA-related protein
MENPVGGTALFDTIYKACLYEFGKVDHAASGNFILLFTDGEDNASHTSAEEAIDACQHSNTAIYAFRAVSQSASDGPRTLAQLASGTGGRVFFDDDPAAVLAKNLAVIEADLRDQYRLVFSPAELKHDGSFHSLELHTPHRVRSVNIRTGYYDRAR